MKSSDKETSDQHKGLIMAMQRLSFIELIFTPRSSIVIQNVVKANGYFQILDSLVLTVVDLLV